jgi:hypothetical protein
MRPRGDGLTRNRASGKPSNYCSGQQPNDAGSLLLGDNKFSNDTGRHSSLFQLFGR